MSQTNRCAFDQLSPIEQHVCDTWAGPKPRPGVTIHLDMDDITRQITAVDHAIAGHPIDKATMKCVVATLKSLRHAASRGRHG